MPSYPEDLRYTKTHEWVRVEGNTAIIGITAYAVEQLGDITYVGLPMEGDDVAKGEAFGSVESVKAQSDVYSPVSGTVAKVNDPLEDNPEYVNEEPYGKGWMVQIELAEPSELDELMDAAAYEKYVAEQD